MCVYMYTLCMCVYICYIYIFMYMYTYTPTRIYDLLNTLRRYHGLNTFALLPHSYLIDYLFSKTQLTKQT